MNSGTVTHSLVKHFEKIHVERCNEKYKHKNDNVCGMNPTNNDCWVMCLIHTCTTSRKAVVVYGLQVHQNNMDL